MSPSIEENCFTKLGRSRFGNTRIGFQKKVGWKIHFAQMNEWLMTMCILGGGFKYFFNFHPYLGNDPIWRAYFSNGLKPPTSIALCAIPFDPLSSFFYESSTSPDSSPAFSSNRIFLLGFPNAIEFQSNEKLVDVLTNRFTLRSK